MSRGQACSDFHAAIELIGKRWNGLVLQALLGGCQRFSEIRGQIPEITDAMLSQRLRDLEEAGVVVRQVREARPVEIRYGLTDVGRRLAPVIEAIIAWSSQWADARRATGPGIAQHEQEVRS
ncbi:helix-turn-helix domain-containing protein [uncultured Aeromicrobium sp.]|uniref:winged helix-turn-helix transcriptional regulator n=1 Tax=uncultured Aeromicrobium sp. TaxID=337820 RepID=UPI0025FB3A89|nr:helix-turn-helix domain-containing protein [uncultured Aeromicrobium sp.]